MVEEAVGGDVDRHLAVSTQQVDGDVAVAARRESQHLDLGLEVLVPLIWFGDAFISVSILASPLLNPSRLRGSSLGWSDGRLLKL